MFFNKYPKLASKLSSKCVRNVYCDCVDCISHSGAAVNEKGKY